jgi:hypothetical protein
MKRGKLLLSTAFVAFLALFCAIDNGYGQGHGRGGGGNGGGNGGGGGRPAGAGQGGGMGVDHGLGTASSHSGGRSDNGLGTAATNSNGRSTAGLERARHAKATANAMTDNELNRYRGLSRKLGTTPEQMRAAYEAALLQNPNLNYGQFVAANVVADNQQRRFPGITSAAILSGLASGDSLGQTLRNLGMTKEQSKIAQRDAEDKINAAKDRSH